VLAQAHVVRLRAHHLDEPAEHAETGVVVGEPLAGREQLRHVVQRRHVLLQAVVADPGVDEDVALEPGGVVQQLPHGDPLGRRLVRDPELRQVRPDRFVQADQALVHQLHHQRAGPELGDRPDLEDRVGGRLDLGRLAEQTGGPVDHLVAPLHGPRRTGNVVLLQQGREPLVKPRVNIVEVAHAR
jgi:hypothetical protein